MTSLCNGVRLRLCLRLWLWARTHALGHISEQFPTEYQDAHRAWRHDARLTGTLDSPAWDTRGLPDDMALWEAAGSLLGRFSND